MIIISDSSVLINLAWIKQLHLLPQIYGNIIVPTAVWKEIVETGAGKPGAQEIQSADWIKVIQPENAPLIHSLRRDLDAGESEAIALAIEQKADLLLIDERLGRATAQHFNIPIVGLIGVLILAKRRNLIQEVKGSLDILRHQAGFYISGALYRRVLNDVKE